MNTMYNLFHYNWEVVNTNKRQTSSLCSASFHSNIGKSVTHRIECLDFTIHKSQKEEESQKLSIKATIFSHIKVWKLTLSTNPSSCATNDLSRPRVLLTDAWLPNANNIRSSGCAEQHIKNCSFLVASKLDTRAGIPSISPITYIRPTYKKIGGKKIISMHCY